jgi:tetratricopeptide (TPR) repeat protein
MHAARRAIELAERRRAKDKLLVAGSWELLGDIALEAGRVEDAAQSYRAAIAALDRVGRGQTADALRPLAQLVGITKRAAHYADAEALLKRQLALVPERGGGSRSFDKASGLVHLAELQARQANTREAMTTGRRAFELIQSEEHSDAGELARRLAELFLDFGEGEAAVPILQHAYEVLRRARGSMDPTVVALGARLAATSADSSPR